MKSATSFVDMVSVRSIIALLHKTQKQRREDFDQQKGPMPGLAALAITGGALGLPALLTSVAGSSRTLYGAELPYHQAASAALIRRTSGDKFSDVSKEMAIRLAQAVHAKASQDVNGRDENFPGIIALGITTAFETDHTRRGSDRAFFAVINDESRTRPMYEPETVELLFERGTWTRDTQDLFCQIVGLNLLLEEFKIKQMPLRDENLPGRVYCPEKFYFPHGGAPTFIFRPTRQYEKLPLELGERTLVDYYGRVVDEGLKGPYSKTCLLPLSANPLHEGHLTMRNEIERLGYEAYFNLEARHPHKGEMADDELERRVRQFSGRAAVVVTRGLGLYAEKARAFPGIKMAISLDVLQMLLDQDLPDCLKNLETCLSQGVQFLVFDRPDLDQPARATCPLPIPERYTSLFHWLAYSPACISSTEIRNTIAGPARS